MSTKNVGITGTWFYLIFTAILAIVAAAALVLVPDMKNQVLGDLPGFLMVFGTKFVVWAVLAALGTWVMSYVILDTPLSNAITKFETPGQTGYTVAVLSTWAIAALMAISGGENVLQYFFNLAIRGSVGLFLAFTLTAVVMRVVFHLKSMDDFRDYVTTPHVAAHAWGLVFGLTAILAIAMYA